MLRLATLAAVLAVTVLFVGCSCGARSGGDHAKAQKSAPTATIVDVAVADGRFTTLVDAVITAGLAETLSGPGPFTVFAPTDEAFAKLPEGTLESLSVEELTAILTYHVVAAKVPAAEAIKTDGQSAATVNGAEIAIAVKDGVVTVNGANVIIADVMASNGVIHVIDQVIIPE